MKKNSDIKVAIVHDWLVGGGAEQVVLELHKMFPDAPIYTSYCTDEWRQRLDNTVVTGWLQKPLFAKLRKYIAPLRIWWFTHLDLSEYDLVISSSGNGEAKGVKTPATTTHICYCHTPTHFYWRHYDQYADSPGFKLGGVGLRLLAGPLRRWDRAAAQRPDLIIANSRHIQQDIKTYYGRESVVIHPPVDVARFSKVKTDTRQGFITVGRQVPYKKVDLIIQACNILDLPLTVIGHGPDHDKLQKIAGPTVRFLTDASDTDVERALANSQAFVFAAYEDFGITPVEAMAAGTPVIAYKAGGALDYVIDGKTGVFFNEQTADSLEAALQVFESDRFHPAIIKQEAAKFDRDVFRRRLTATIEKILANR